MIIYIAGPMTGLPDYNHHAFHAVAKQLRSVGHEVINPAEQFDGNQTLPWETYMRAGISSVLRSEMVCALPGWEDSKGASLEVAVARAIGIPIETV